MEFAGISKRIINLASVFVGHLKLGLVFVTVGTSCFFAAISGSGPATVAALGPIVIPAMEDAGYDRGFAAALMASSGNVGIIIPPSIAFVVFGVLAEVSIGRLFIAGIIPGLLISGSLILVSMIVLKKQNIKLTKETKSTRKEKLVVTKDAIWGLMTPIIILGGIYGGIVTPTEAAGIAAAYSFFVGIFIYKEINFKNIKKLFVKAAISSAVIMFIIGNASLFAWVIAINNISANMANGFLAISSNKYVLLLIMNVIILIAGCFVDAASAYYIFVPIMLPIIFELGIDPIVFGVFMTTNLAIGMSTPPIGLDIIMASNVSGVSMKEISYKVWPFIASSLVALVLIVLIPQISLWLPNLMGVK
jgi:C4-dicarboxylate transporter DctM subunit